MPAKLIVIFLVSIVVIASCKSGGGSEPPVKESAPIPVGQTLKTTYFDMAVNYVKTTTLIKIDELQELKPMDGNKYLVIDLTLKNTDKESRKMEEGILKIIGNGRQQYRFGESESVRFDGWGLITDAINPLVTKRTRLVYKLPESVKGTAIFIPDKANRNQFFNLGAVQ